MLSPLISDSTEASYGSVSISLDSESLPHAVKQVNPTATTTNPIFFHISVTSYIVSTYCEDPIRYGNNYYDNWQDYPLANRLEQETLMTLYY